MNKVISKSLLMLSTVAFLASCSPKTSSSTEPVSGWPNELSLIMNNLFGEEIPYIQLDSNYTYSVLGENTDDPYLYIQSKNDENKEKEYTNIVKDAGYTFIEVNDEYDYYRYVYSKSLSEDYSLMLQFDQFPGNDEHDKAFEIFAWKAPVDDPTIDYELVNDWTNEEKTMFNNAFGEIIPLAPLSASHTIEFVEADTNIVIKDSIGKEDAYNNYFDVLDDNEDWNLNLTYAQAGYTVFEKYADNIENGKIYISIDYKFKQGFSVDTWLIVAEPITDWTAAEKAAIKDIFMDENVIPVAPISVRHSFKVYAKNEYGDFIDIIDPTPIKDAMNKYADILEASGFEENRYYFERFGYRVFDMPSVIMPAFNIEIWILDAGDYLEIQISKEEIMSGVGFTSDFPHEYIEAFLAKYDVAYKPIPEFDPDSSGEYMYAIGEEEMQVGIYTEEHTVTATSYSQMLTEAGWTVDTSKVTTEGYYARKEGYDFYLRYWSDELEFALFIYPNSITPYF